MIEVEILNFQSIERAALKIDGFTAIVGRSNIGKSAVVRAIRCALTAPKGTDFVRHGEKCERRIKGNKKCRCQTTVTFKTPERTVVWEKGDAINQYTVTEKGVEPVLFTAINHGTPDFLKPEFEPMKIGSSSPDLIQVSEQFKPIFLLDQSGPTTADVLSDVAQLDDINKAVTLVNKDRKEANAIRKVREKDVTRLNETLQGYEGLDEAVGRTKKVATAFEAVEAAQEQLEWLDEHVEALMMLAPAIKRLMGVSKCKLPDIDDVTATGKRAIKAHTLYAELAEKGPALRKFMGVEKVEMPELDPVTAKNALLQKIDRWLGHLNTFKKVGKQVKLVDGAKLPKLPPKGIGQLQQLQSFIDRLADIEADCGTLEGELAEAKEELAEVEVEFEKLGVCPTCSQKISAEHVHRAVSA